MRSARTHTQRPRNHSIPTFERPSIQEQLAPHPLDDPRLFGAGRPSATQNPPEEPHEPYEHAHESYEHAHAPLARALDAPFINFRTLRVLGSVGLEYLACSERDSLDLFDISRIFIWLTLHDLRRAFGGETPDTRTCGDVGVITLRPRLVNALTTHKDNLERLGIEFTELSPTSIVPNRLPRPLWEIDVTQAFQRISEGLNNQPVDDFPRVRALAEQTLALLNLPAETPNLSNYDLRMMLAGLDEIEPDDLWRIVVMG